MIITRSPLRLSLGGGGTDLPSYYQAHGGFVLAAAIDKYVYITHHRTFRQEIIVKYSRLERVAAAGEVEHPIVREALRLLGLERPHLELTAMADIPSGTGLGSSGSFTTALLKALHTALHHTVPAVELAEQACEIEIGRLHEPVGKQDQYIAALGGIQAMTFHPDGRVAYRPCDLPEDTLVGLEENLLLFYTGVQRSAGAVLREQDARSQAGDPATLDNLHRTKEAGLAACAALEAGDLEGFARLMDRQWEQKKARTPAATSPFIDECYAHARAHGALGGKLIGAGGGGFLLFYASDKVRLRHAMRERGLQEVRWRFDFEGTKVVTHN